MQGCAWIADLHEVRMCPAAHTHLSAWQSQRHPTSGLPPALARGPMGNSVIACHATNCLDNAVAENCLTTCSMLCQVWHRLVAEGIPLLVALRLSHSGSSRGLQKTTTSAIIRWPTPVCSMSHDRATLPTMSNVQCQAPYNVFTERVPLLLLLRLRSMNLLQSAW